MDIGAFLSHPATTFCVGLTVGITATALLLRSSVRLQKQQTELMAANLKDAFSSLASDALKKSNEQFLQLAGENLSKHTQQNEQALTQKKGLIDQSVTALKADLEKVQKLMTDLERDRHMKFGELNEQLKKAAQQTEKLQSTTQQLKEALANSRTRGQWGERMAEDVLSLAGFIEGINYRKQQTLAGEGGRPDYTFMLPRNRVVHMDVKFPLDNYLGYLEAASPLEKENFRSQFLKDVRNRVKEATKRGYVSAADQTLDYVIVFIPNEQVYAFIHENDNGILDEALRSKVILCSPITLYAILSVIREGVRNFQLENTAGEIMQLLGQFDKQWKLFIEELEKVERQFSTTHNSFTSLITTRRNQLEKPLVKIDALRRPDGADTPLLGDTSE